MHFLLNWFGGGCLDLVQFLGQSCFAGCDVYGHRGSTAWECAISHTTFFFPCFRQLQARPWPALSHTVVNTLAALAAWSNAMKNTVCMISLVFSNSYFYILENRIGPIVWKHKSLLLFFFLIVDYPDLEVTKIQFHMNLNNLFSMTFHYSI